jgi:Bacterial RNA polymerase, alpha chain C terminal domain
MTTWTQSAFVPKPGSAILAGGPLAAAANTTISSDPELDWHRRPGEGWMTVTFRVGLDSEGRMTEPVPELVEELDLSVRAVNCIKNTGCTRVAEVVARTPEEWCAVYNFGRRSFNELREELARHGLRLRNDTGQAWRYHDGKSYRPPLQFVGPEAKPIVPSTDWIEIGRQYAATGQHVLSIGARQIVRGLLAEIERLQAARDG